MDLEGLGIVILSHAKFLKAKLDKMGIVLEEEEASGGGGCGSGCGCH